MNTDYQDTWKRVEPLLRIARRKDFVLHTQMVVRAMEEIMMVEKGDPNILIPAAMLHDVGWSGVPEKLQMSDDPTEKQEALKQHISKAPAIIRDVLLELGYEGDRIEKIVEIVVAHKFVDPTEKEKQMLIDADTLADTYKEAFYSDVKSYGSTPARLLEFRSKNNFYTQVAKDIFRRELLARKTEIYAIDSKVG